MKLLKCPNCGCELENWVEDYELEKVKNACIILRGEKQ